jgi:hypothetical protein
MDNIIIPSFIRSISNVSFRKTYQIILFLYFVTEKAIHRFAMATFVFAALFAINIPDSSAVPYSGFHFSNYDEVENFPFPTNYSPSDSQSDDESAGLVCIDCS